MGVPPKLLFPFQQFLGSSTGNWKSDKECQEKTYALKILKVELFGCKIWEELWIWTIFWGSSCLISPQSAIGRKTALVNILSRKCTRNVKFANSTTLLERDVCLTFIWYKIWAQLLSLATFGRECLRFSFSPSSQGEAAVEEEVRPKKLKVHMIQSLDSVKSQSQPTA